MPTPRSALTPARARDIAARRLSLLGAQTYSVKGQLLGRIRFEQGKLNFARGLHLEEVQKFCVIGFRALVFESTLRHIGPVDFLRFETPQEIEACVVDALQNLLLITRKKLAMARFYLPKAYVDVPTWEIRAPVSTHAGEGIVAFDARVERVEIRTLEGQRCKKTSSYLLPKERALFSIAEVAKLFANERRVAESKRLSAISTAGEIIKRTADILTGDIGAISREPFLA